MRKDKSFVKARSRGLILVHSAQTHREKGILGEERERGKETSESKQIDMGEE